MWVLVTVFLLMSVRAQQEKRQLRGSAHGVEAHTRWSPFFALYLMGRR